MALLCQQLWKLPGKESKAYADDSREAGNTGFTFFHSVLCGLISMHFIFEPIFKVILSFF